MESPEDRIWILLSRKFSASITEAEDTELQQLLRYNSDAQYTNEILNKIWKIPAAPVTGNEDQCPNDQTGYPFKENISTDARYESPESQGRYRVHHRRVKLIAVAACILLIAGLFFTFPGIIPRKQKTGIINTYTVSTQAGEKKMITLPDGTTVWLNVASKLSYPAGFAADSIRMVTLSGEAYFEVKHDSTRPFMIHTKNMDIRDIGTAFNVKSYPDEALTEASLITGAIEVTVHDNADRKIRLKPKEKIVVYQNKHFEKYSNTDSLKNMPVQDIQVSGYSIAQIKPDPVIRTFPETAWMQNDLVFKNQPLEELAKIMERRYAVKIIITDNNIRQYQLTGIFKDETIGQALQELQVIAPFRYKIKDNVVTIYRKDLE